MVLWMPSDWWDCRKFPLNYDAKCYFVVHHITFEKAKYKLWKVQRSPSSGDWFPIQIDFETGKMTSFIKFDIGNLCMMTGGANLGRTCMISNRETFYSLNVFHVKDTNALQNFHYLWMKSTNHRFPFPKENISTSPLLKREIRVSEMIGKVFVFN